MRPDGIFPIVLNSLIALAICMTAGFLARRFKIIGDEATSGMSNLLLKVTMPATIIMSMQRPFTQELLTESLLVLVLAAAIFLFGGLIGTIAARLTHMPVSKKTIWQFALTHPNVGYLGIPLTLAVFGSDCLMYTSMVNVSFNILSFTLGVWYFSPAEASGIKGLKNVAKTPAIIATVVGFVMFVASVALPAPIVKGVSFLSDMTTPMSMIIIGSILAKSDIRKALGDISVYVMIFIRLIAIPVLVYLALSPFIKNPMMLGTILLLSATPAAAITAIFAEQYKGDSVLASQTVALSTIFCIITLPLISLLLY